MFGPKHDIELLRAYTAEAIADDEQLERDLRAYVYFFEFILTRDVNGGETFTGCSFSQR
ncbi:unnamed protein product, partial [marine sediment metagenome]